MATFRKRGSKWQVQVRLHGNRPVSRTFTLKADAEQWARQTEAAIERGEPVRQHNPCSLSVGELLDRYRLTVTPTKKGAVSEAARLGVIARSGIAGLPIDKLMPADVCAYRDRRLQDVRPATVRRELAVLRHCLEIARREWGVAVAPNPVAQITIPADSRPRDRRLCADELERIGVTLARSRTKNLRSIILFAIHTGMRRSELLMLRWRDIDRASSIAHLTDTKNGQPRTVPLSPAAVAALPAMADGHTPDDCVFPLSANALRLAWERLKRRANIQDLRFHDLRHEAISRFFEMGLSVPEVSLISGHKDARMLFRYTHLKAERVAEKLQVIASTEHGPQEHSLAPAQSCNLADSEPG